MRISILTPSFNHEPYIEQNILSVLHQDYPALEHVIVDDGSTDRTPAILRRYPHLLWTAQPNAGQSAALNRAFKMSTGEIIGWINSDDYLEPNVLPDVARHFEDPAVQWIVGDLTDVCEPSRRRVFRPAPTLTFQRLLRDPDIVRQPATFFRRSALLQAGPWDESLFMVMDLDLWLRVARIAPPLMTRVPYACFRRHAAQKSTPRNAARQRAEILRVLRRHGAPAATLLRIAARKQVHIWKSSLRGLLESAAVLRPRYA